MPAFDFNIKIESDPPYFNLAENNYRFLSQISLYDSILESYPTCEIIFPDNIGYLTSNMFPVEFSDLTVTFGNERKGYFNHKFYFENNNTMESSADSRKKQFIHSDYMLFLKSSFDKQDFEKKRSFNANMSDAVSEILSSYEFTNNTSTDNLQISPTDNTDFWYQADVTDMEFIESHLKYAYSKDYPKSPFVSFFTLNNKFYFKPIEELMRQSPIATLELTEKELSYLNDNEILSYDIENLGTEANKENYSKPILKTDNATNSTSEELLLLQDHIVHLKADKSDKFVVRERDLKNYKTEAYGLYEQKDSNNYKGYSNYSFIESYLPHRMTIQANFRPDIKTGSVIKIKTQDSYRGAPVETYQNNWLVLKSNHAYFSDGTAYSLFTIGRNTMPILKNHLLYNDFLSQ